MLTFMNNHDGGLEIKSRLPSTWQNGSEDLVGPLARRPIFLAPLVTLLGLQVSLLGE